MGLNTVMDVIEHNKKHMQILFTGQDT